MNRRDLYREYLKTEHWQGLRHAAKERYGHRCVSCDSVNKLEVHHLTYRNWIDCTTDDLMVLCDRCHTHVHKSPRLAELQETADGNDQKRREVMAYLAGIATVTHITITNGGRYFEKERKEMKASKKRRKKAQRARWDGNAKTAWTSWSHSGKRGHGTRGPYK